MLKSHYVMIGGFLGAGKTTSILQLARLLRDQEKSVGLITNDQSIGLVDTTMLRSHGFETEEITGGCFCCRFNSLIDAASKLNESTRPDLLIAEPVGSCTDLQATVGYPLQKIYGDQYEVAPLSVVLDPIRTRRVLGIEKGKNFSPKVLYIFEKQLEEADILVINKCDLISVSEQDALEAHLRERFPHTQVVRISARTGFGLENWLETILSTTPSNRRAMEVDYDLYADGEALLGWLNISADLSGDEFDGNSFVQKLGQAIHQRLTTDGVEVAHLKMTLTPDTGNDLAVGNLVRNDGSIELSHQLAELLENGQLIINLRAEGDPETLRQLAVAELEQLAGDTHLTVEMLHAEAFRPGRPTPTHRLTNVS